MAGSRRLRPERLSEKLLYIRLTLGLSQGEMLRRVGLEEQLERSEISAFELGKREPPLLVLLSYARAANVSMEALVDDELYLPDKLPALKRSEGIRRRPRGA